MRLTVEWTVTSKDAIWNRVSSFGCVPGSIDGQLFSYLVSAFNILWRPQVIR